MAGAGHAGIMLATDGGTDPIALVERFGLGVGFLVLIVTGWLWPKFAVAHIIDALNAAQDLARSLATSLTEIRDALKEIARATGLLEQLARDVVDIRRRLEDESRRAP